MNHFSPSKERLRASTLYRELDAMQAVLDPALEVRDGQALMIDGDFTGARDGHSQYEYLKQKFGIMTTAGRDVHFDAAGGRTRAPEG